VNKAAGITPQFVDTFPAQLQPGVLYVSATYSTAAHLCGCGCGEEVITPLSPTRWVLTFDGAVSLRPSVGNWSLPCRSHYFIDRGHIRWARSFSGTETQPDREHDRRLPVGVASRARQLAATVAQAIWSRLRRR
jgi:hypothetical protein